MQKAATRGTSVLSKIGIRIMNQYDTSFNWHRC